MLILYGLLYTLDSQGAENYQGIYIFADSPSHFTTQRPDSSGPEIKSSERGRMQRRDEMSEQENA